MNAKFYLKRPAVVEAIQWKSGVDVPGIKYCNCASYGADSNGIQRAGCSYCGSPYVETADGGRKVNDGDYIVREEGGIFSVLKADEFEKKFSEIVIDYDRTANPCCVSNRGD